MCDIPEFIVVTHGFPQSSYHKNGRPWFTGYTFCWISLL